MPSHRSLSTLLLLLSMAGMTQAMESIPGTGGFVPTGKLSHNYRNLHFALAPRVAGMPLALAVQDQRPYVLSGEKQPTYVGTYRATFGNPFAIVTKSGSPLADDLGLSLAESLIANGYRATLVASKPSEGRAALLGRMRAGGAQRLVLVTLKDWKHDLYVRIDRHIDLQLDILDGAGKPLCDNAVSYQGEAPESKRRSYQDSGRDADLKAGQVIDSTLECVQELFNIPKACMALGMSFAQADAAINAVQAQSPKARMEAGRAKLESAKNGIEKGQIQYEIGQAYLDMGDEPHALQFFKAAAGRKSALGAYWAGRLSWTRGSKWDTKSYYKLSLKLNPDQPALKKWVDEN